MVLLVTFFVLAIAFSFLCSVLEAVLLSITPYYVKIQEQDKTVISKDLARYKEDIDLPLSAILTLNTIANTLGAVGVGSQAAVVFGATRIELFGFSFLSWEAIIAGTMTLCILIFSEIIPKTIGANNWEALTPFVVRTLKVMIFLLAPFVWLSRVITTRLKKDKSKPVLTRSDFLKITNIGKESGALQDSERRIIRSLLKFNHVVVEDIMTPKQLVITARNTMSVREFCEKHDEFPFSRIPVYEEDSMKIVGYVHKDELLIHLVTDNGNVLLGDVLRELFAVDNSIAIPDLLEKFLHSQEYIALVKDSARNMQGIVTVEDIIETVLGFEVLADEDDRNDWQQLARQYWQQRIQESIQNKRAGE